MWNIAINKTCHILMEIMKTVKTLSILCRIARLYTHNMASLPGAWKCYCGKAWLYDHDDV